MRSLGVERLQCAPLNYLTSEINGAIEMQHNNINNARIPRTRLLFVTFSVTVERIEKVIQFTVKCARVV